MEVRLAVAADRSRIDAVLAANNADRVARRGQLVDATRHPTLVAEDGADLAGVLTFILEGRACEILALYVANPWRGTGTQLLALVERIARAADCELLWLTTTNDNIEALRFYQRRGFSCRR